MEESQLVCLIQLPFRLGFGVFLNNNSMYIGTYVRLMMIIIIITIRVIRVINDLYCIQIQVLSQEVLSKGSSCT